MKLCPDHGIPLIKRRGTLHANLAHELRVFVPETTDQLVELAAETPPEVPTALAPYLVNRIAGPAGPVWLDGQTIEQAVKATEMLGASLVFGPKFSFKSATEADWDEAREAGWRYTSRGEAGVREAFAFLQERAANKGIGGIDYGSVFTHLYAWLAQKKAPDYHGPIKQLLRNYIQDEMEVSIGLKLFGVPLERREKISVRWLAADSGVGEALLAPYLAKKGLLSEDQLTYSSRLQLVDRHPAEDLANHLANAVSLTDLIPALGATPVLVASLLETEMIVPMVMAAHHTGPSKGLVAREAVDQLLDQLMRSHLSRTQCPIIGSAWRNARSGPGSLVRNFSRSCSAAASRGLPETQMKSGLPRFAWISMRSKLWPPEPRSPPKIETWPLLRPFSLNFRRQLYPCFAAIQTAFKAPTRQIPEESAGRLSFSGRFMSGPTYRSAHKMCFRAR